MTVLLKECQDIQVRCGSFGNNVNATNIASRTSTDTEAENIISEHLVSFFLIYFILVFEFLHFILACNHFNLGIETQLTFKDINGLVEQNVQLRSLVRSLSGQLENQEVEFKVG